MMMNVQILFSVLSVVIIINHNDVSAANPNNQIEVLLETLIQKVDVLEKNIENVKHDVAKGFDTVARKTTSRADAIFIAISDEVRSHKVNVEDISRVLANGYHFVGNGIVDTHDDFIDIYGLSFSQCLNLCTKKRHEAGESWNSFTWGVPINYCNCYKGGRGHNPDASVVHFRI